MAEGKNIELRIVATGGEQAAAEVRKVDTAVDSLSGGSGAGSSGKGLKSLAEETTKVSAANVKMGTGFQNVGYQVQDLAVQIGSGTSAFRALGQQLPQLLSGFGPLGITLGTVAAVALPLAGAMFNLGNAAEEAGEKADEAADKLEKLTDKRADKAALAAAKELQSFRDALDDETLAYKRQNDEIQRTIDLLQAKRRAQTEVDSADAALELAKIDASNAPETEKIKQRAKVQEGLERKRFEDRKAEAGERVNASYNRATGATGDATLKRGEESAERQRLADEQAEAAALKGKIVAADAAAESLKAADARVAKSKKELDQFAGQVSPETGEALYTPSQLAAKEAELNARKAERDQLATAAGGASAADRARLEELKGKDGTGGSVAELEKSIAGLTKAAEALEEAARKAQGDYGSTREIETAKLGGDFEATKRRLETNRITTGTQGRRVAEQEKAEADRKAEKDRDKEDAEAKKASKKAAGEGRAAERLVPGNAPAEARKKIQEISDGLQNGDQGGEVEKLLTAVEQLAAFVKRSGDGKGAGKDLSRRIEILEQQIRGK